LSILDADIEDLEASVSALEGGGAGWGIERNEVVKRRRELDRVKKEVDVSSEATGKAYHFELSQRFLPTANTLDIKASTEHDVFYHFIVLQQHRQGQATCSRHGRYISGHPSRRGR
jgi:hypothetical protein